MIHHNEQKSISERKQLRQKKMKNYLIRFDQCPQCKQEVILIDKVESPEERRKKQRNFLKVNLDLCQDCCIKEWRYDL